MHRTAPDRQNRQSPLSLRQGGGGNLNSLRRLHIERRAMAGPGFPHVLP